jgi:hypothetical protein
MKERIVAAALREDGIVLTGAHHHHIIRYAAPLLGKKAVGREQGFITNENRFVGREEAAKIAFAARQIEQEKDILFSEDLWQIHDDVIAGLRIA